MKLPARRVADANSLSFPRYADAAHTRLLFEPLPEGFIIGRRLDDNKGPFGGDHVTTSGQAKEKDGCQESGTFHRAPLSLWPNATLSRRAGCKDRIAPRAVRPARSAAALR